jgi:excisionase family DNA binding protein
VENNTATAEEPEYLTVEEVSSLLRVSAPTIYRRCADGQLPHIRVGDHGPIRIPASQLERLYEQAVPVGGSPAGDSFPGTYPVERRGTQKLGESSPAAHAGQEGES